MYVPDQYRADDPSAVLDLVSANPLAIMISNGRDRPYATHLPTCLAHRTLTPRGLVGATIYGHMNRMNPHWASLGPESTVVLIFQGPHGYVSPTVYDLPEAAPTWDFSTIHVHGTLRPVTGQAETLRIITATVRALEEHVGTGWDMTSSLPYFRRLLPGVGAFRVEVTAVESMFKLSQEQPVELRRRVAAAFARSEVGQHRQLASMITEMNGLDRREDDRSRSPEGRPTPAEEEDRADNWS
jgi:transcriptional regulator